MILKTVVLMLALLICTPPALAQDMIEAARQTLQSPLRLHEHQISEAVVTLVKGPFKHQDQLRVLAEGRNVSAVIRMTVFKALPHMTLTSEHLQVARDNTCFNPSYHSRLICVAVAGRLASAESTELLFELLDDSDASVALASGRALARRDLKAKLADWVSAGPIDWDSTKGTFLCDHLQNQLSQKDQSAIIRQIEDRTSSSGSNELLRSVKQFIRLCSKGS